jgi:hypothetical protein
MLTIQEARRQAKAHMRAQLGADWWKRDDVAQLRAAIGKAARLILAQQQAQTPGDVAKVDTPPAAAQVPEAKPVVTVTPDEARLAALRVQAAQLFPTDSSMPEKVRKAQYDKRRRWLVANGAPRVEPKEGHTAFGRKLVGGEWVKL